MKHTDELGEFRAPTQAGKQANTHTHTNEHAPSLSFSLKRTHASKEEKKICKHLKARPSSLCQCIRREA